MLRFYINWEFPLPLPPHRRQPHTLLKTGAVVDLDNDKENTPAKDGLLNEHLRIHDQFSHKQWHGRAQLGELRSFSSALITSYLLRALLLPRGIQ